MGLSLGHLLVLLVIVLLVFGTKKLRNMGGDVGGAIKNFKSAMKEGEDDASKNAAQLTGSSDNKDGNKG